MNNLQMGYIFNDMLLSHEWIGKKQHPIYQQYADVLPFFCSNNISQQYGSFGQTIKEEPPSKHMLCSYFSLQ